MMKPSEMTDEELTRAVAEEVMPDWKYVIDPISGVGLVFGPIPNDPQHRLEIKNPLHRADHWWMVVERMGETSYPCFDLSRDLCGYSRATFSNLAFIKFIAINKREGRAICEAALAAERGKEGE